MGLLVVYSVLLLVTGDSLKNLVPLGNPELISAIPIGSSLLQYTNFLASSEFWQFSARKLVASMATSKEVVIGSPWQVPSVSYP